jgi:phosphoserine phosphatase SerB
MAMSQQASLFIVPLFGPSALTQLIKLVRQVTGLQLLDLQLAGCARISVTRVWLETDNPTAASELIQWLEQHQVGGWQQLAYQPYDRQRQADCSRRARLQLLGSPISQSQLIHTCQTVSQKAVIDYLSCLSTELSCAWQLSLAALADQLLPTRQQLRAMAQDLSQSLGLDVNIQLARPWRFWPRLVVFDMDSTLIAAEVIDELAKVAGVGQQVAGITARAMAGELDFKQSFTQRVALLKGLPESALAGIAKNLPLSPGAVELITVLGNLGCKTALVSGGFNYFARYLQQQLGLDYAYANPLDIQQGQVTGRVSQPIIDAQAKADRVTQLATEQQLGLDQVIVLGDGANDLAMLQLAELSVAYRAKPVVKAQADAAISTLGLDALLYLLGINDRERQLLRD